MREQESLVYSNPTVTQLSVTGGGAGKKEGFKTADGQMVCKLETTEKGSRFISFKNSSICQKYKSKGHKAPLRSENQEIGKASDLAALRVRPEGNPGGP